MFLGIDPSLTGSGLVIIDNNYKIITNEKFSTPTVGVERLYHLELKFLEFLEKFKDTLYICIEGPAMRETGRVFDIGGWYHLIYLTLYKKGFAYNLVAPLQLKKYVSGVGVSKGKATVMLDVFKNFSEEIRDDDIADAYVLARMAHDYFLMFKQDIELTTIKKYQLEVLNKMHKSEIESKEKSLL